MKNFCLLIIATILFSSLFTACRKSNSSSGNLTTIPSNDSFYALVDGHSYLGFDFGGTYYQPASIFMLEAHGLGGTTANHIYLNFPDIAQPAHYDLSTTSSATARYEEDTMHFAITSGSLNIVSDNSRYVTGTFNFMAVAGGQSRAITAGYFFLHK